MWSLFVSLCQEDEEWFMTSRSRGDGASLMAQRIATRTASTVGGGIVGAIAYGPLAPIGLVTGGVLGYYGASKVRSPFHYLLIELRLCS